MGSSPFSSFFALLTSWISFFILIVKAGMDIRALFIDAGELDECISTCGGFFSELSDETNSAFPSTLMKERADLRKEYEKLKKNEKPSCNSMATLYIFVKWVLFRLCMSSVNLRKVKTFRTKVEAFHTKAVMVKAIQDITENHEESASQLTRVALIHSSWYEKRNESAAYTLAYLYLHGLAGLEKNGEMCVILLSQLAVCGDQYWRDFVSAMIHFLDLPSYKSDFESAKNRFLELLRKFKVLREKAEAHSEYIAHPLENLSQFYVGLIYRLKPVVDSHERAREYMEKASGPIEGIKIEGGDIDMFRRDFFAIIDIAICYKYGIEGYPKNEALYKTWIDKILNRVGRDETNIWKAVVKIQGVDCGTPFRLCVQDKFYVGFCLLHGICAENSEENKNRGREYINASYDAYPNCRMIQIIRSDPEF